MQRSVVLQALLVATCAFVASAAEPDVAAVKAEPVPERRSQMALERAAASFSAARLAHGQADMKGTESGLNEMAEMVELSLNSLVETGKHPSKMGKHYKRGEQKTRDLLRRLDTLVADASIDDRPMVESTRKRVYDVHDRFLSGVMSRKEKR